MATSAFAKNIKALRESRGLRQEDLSAAIGVTTVSISNWERGVSSQPKEQSVIEKIKDFFDASDADLFGYTDGFYAKRYGITELPTGAKTVGSGASSMVPIRVLGATYANNPDDPVEFDGEAMLYEDMASRHPNCYALQVNGSCMNRVFTDEDHIFVDPDMALRDGVIAVMLIDGKSETRRVKMGNGSMMLVSESHDPMPDIIIRDGDGTDAICQGVVFWWQARREIG